MPVALPLVLLVSFAPPEGSVRHPGRVQAKDDGTPLSRLDRLLRGIDVSERHERLSRWRGIFELGESHSELLTHLRRVATGGLSGYTRYERYVAAANLAGFGDPTGLGPNSVQGQPLAKYLEFHQRTGQRSLRSGSVYYKRLILDPRLNDLRVTVPPNEQNDLRFQEILWLVFRTSTDG
jgi:hypothetical protein